MNVYEFLWKAKCRLFFFCHHLLINAMCSTLIHFGSDFLFFSSSSSYSKMLFKFSLSLICCWSHRNLLLFNCLGKTKGNQLHYTLIQSWCHMHGKSNMSWKKTRETNHLCEAKGSQDNSNQSRYSWAKRTNFQGTLAHSHTHNELCSTERQKE